MRNALTASLMTQANINGDGVSVSSHLIKLMKLGGALRSAMVSGGSRSIKLGHFLSSLFAPSQSGREAPRPGARKLDERGLRFGDA